MWESGQVGGRQPTLYAFAAGVAGVEIVPEADINFVELPAQEHLAPVAKMRKIDQTPVEILDLDAEFVDATELGVELEHVQQQPGNLFAANVRARLLQLLAQLFAGFVNGVAPAMRVLKRAAEFGNQCPSFLKGEVFLKEMGHKRVKSGQDCLSAGLPASGGAEGDQGLPASGGAEGDEGCRSP